MSHAIIEELRSIAGPRHTLVDPAAMRRFEEGYRFGFGTAIAVVLPASLVELWRVLLACVRHDVILIIQAANTGLTGGSTPNGEYDREVVIVSTARLGGIHLIEEARQAVCLPGSTLYDLEAMLAPHDREPHSVIGSSCIGASVVGGICNNSGGALVRRGPAYTEYSIFARVDQEGTVQLINHLGIDLPGGPEDVLAALETGRFSASTVSHGGAGSDSRYGIDVRDVDAESPARFNADPKRLFEAAGSAGRVVVFAVRVDTFAKPERTSTFYIGTSSPDELTEIRRRLLTESTDLPISGEYIHRDAFNVAEVYGKDVFLAIQAFGTARLPKLFALKDRIDRLARRIPIFSLSLSDRLLQLASRLYPSHLPAKMRRYRDLYEHHLIVKVSDSGIDETRDILNDILPSSTGAMFECTPEEAQKAFLHRFAVAGAAVRYRAVHPDRVEHLVSLDVALRRNDSEWFERLPGEISSSVSIALYYGHFFCHVFHHDYILVKGIDPVALEHAMLGVLDERGAEYPAEHNVGHLYQAADSLAEHYRSLDPGNRLNPGIGLTSRVRDWN